MQEDTLSCRSMLLTGQQGRNLTLDSAETFQRHLFRQRRAEHSPRSVPEHYLRNRFMKHWTGPYNVSGVDMPSVTYVVSILKNQGTYPYNSSQHLIPSKAATSFPVAAASCRRILPQHETGATASGERLRCPGRDCPGLCFRRCCGSMAACRRAADHGRR